MHAHAQLAEPDMFAGTPQALPAVAAGLPIDGHHIEFAGVLLRNAEVRSMPADDGLHSVPVVHVQLKSVGSGSSRYCSADIPFTDATRHEAEALAKSLTKRSTVTVSAPLSGMRVTFTKAAFITLHQEH